MFSEQKIVTIENLAKWITSGCTGLEGAMGNEVKKDISSTFSEGPDGTLTFSIDFQAEQTVGGL